MAIALAPMSVGTAFFERQRELNTKLSWGEWSGYHAAAVFADFVDIEYNAIREAAAVIDVTPLYKYEVSGADAAALLDRVVALRHRSLPLRAGRWAGSSQRLSERPGAHGRRC